MRLPVDPARRELPARLALLAGLTLAAASLSAASRAAEAPLQPNGPAADYPVTIGAPFTIDGVTYTPADKMNVDQVGYAVSGGEGGSGISLAHRTLPLPSYVEVTSLKTGRTILVRAERRGPMSGDALVELSPGAAAQLGMAAPREPVRVRRVNPPEAERALLRAGQNAPARMDTPMSLVAVLMRKLEPDTAAAAAPAPATATLTPAPAAPARAVAPPPAATKRPGRVAAAPVARPLPAPAPVATKEAPPAKTPAASAPAAPAIKSAQAAQSARTAYVVQVGAFASEANAAAAARKVGGTVSPSGKYHRVRIGGFASAAEARAALAKARAAGYSDARIQRAD